MGLADTVARRIRGVADAASGLRARWSTPREPPQAVQPSTPAASAIAQRFASLRNDGNAHFFDALAAHLAGSVDDPCLPMYFNFALSANARGRRAAEMIDTIVPLAGKRALDVGCAYGGFIVGLASLGADPAGFDIDASLLALGEHNYRDVGRRFPTHVADLTKASDIAPFREAFDVITCNDVIEHVSDPRIAIRHIGTMLRPGGLAYFEIPNRDEVSAVISDGHYQLFGITQLDAAQAARYFEAHAPGTPYGVGHYLTLDEYRALFTEAGLVMEDRTDPAMVRTLESVEELLTELERGLPDKLASVPEPVRKQVAASVREYLVRARVTRSDGPAERTAYLSRYGTSFWRVIGTKPILDAG